MSTEITIWLPIVSLIVAGLAVFFGPMSQLAIARHQARVTTHSVNRQNWINSLREQLAVFITNASDLMANSRSLTYQEAELIKITLEMHLAMNRIRLLANPSEPDHKEMLSLLETISWAAKDATEKDIHHIQNLVSIAQKVLKREWERVKILD